MRARTVEGRKESHPAESDVAAASRFPRRQLRLTTANGARLIRDALAAGGELWVSGAGQSMHPTIRHADSVLLSPMRRDVKRGDIVLVPLGPALMLHRVDEIDGNVVLTRGDGRESRDPPIARSQLLARALAVRDPRGLRLLTPTWRFGGTPLVRFVLAELYRRVRRVDRRLREVRQHRAR